MVDANDLVSVIMPAYNAKKYIADAIKSVLEQTYPYFELIIVDDASQDRTVEIVRSFNDERIKLIRHKTNQGPGGARNTALEVAKGKWVTVLDADDQYLPNRLEVLVRAAREAGDGYFIADDLLISFDTPNGLEPWKRQSLNYGINFRGKNWDDYDLCGFLESGTPVIKPFICLQHIRDYNLRYCPGCYYGEDMEFVCHLFRTGLRFRLLAEPLYYYRLTPGSLTGGRGRREELIKVYERLYSGSGFSNAEKRLFSERMKKIKKELAYDPFPQALKRREYTQALKILMRHPWYLLEFARRLPRSATYRIAAFKFKGAIK